MFLRKSIFSFQIYNVNVELTNILTLINIYYIKLTYNVSFLNRNDISLSDKHENTLKHIMPMKNERTTEKIRKNNADFFRII